MQFFVLRPWNNELFGRRYAFAEIVDPDFRGEPYEYGVCPVCGSPLGGRPWLPPQRANLSSSNVADLVWGSGFDLIVSERLLGYYKNSGLSGITRIDPPIEVVKIGGRKVNDRDNAPPTLRHVRYVCEGADLDDIKSGAVRPSSLCPHCRQGMTAIERVVLKQASWQGDDIFEVLGLPGSILVTERFRDMFEEHRLLNAQFVPIAAYHFDFRTFPSGH